ncbi:hypothetical protein ABFS83_10G034500 [Erythranthe nasuta]
MSWRLSLVFDYMEHDLAGLASSPGVKFTEPQFFTTKSYACDPSSRPKYPPSKEMDAKHRDEEARRLRAAGKTQTDAVKKTRTLLFHGFGPSVAFIAGIELRMTEYTGKEVN